MPGARRLAVLLMLVLGAGVLPTWSLVPATAAPDDPTFTALRGFAPTGATTRVRPGDYAANRVDLAALRSQLDTGLVSVPDPSGRLVDFEVEKTQRMESELAAAHPEIATYSGRGVEDARVSVAIDVTQMGFHASVRAPGERGAWFVDPAYNRRGTTEHLSYYGSSLPEPEQRRVEGEIETIGKSVDAKITANATEDNAPVSRKLYRLALTSDPSYAAYFGTENVLAEKVTLMNRVNQVYNDDLAIDLRLVNATEALNLDTEAEAVEPDGPCGAAPCFRSEDLGDPADPDDDLPGDLDFCSGLTLGQNRTVLGQLVGASNYDIGHIALGKNGGGVAYLGVVGQDYKGGGCTGLPDPIGDFFAIDYVAHEMGHQFAGNHTFNGAAGNCGGNISEASVEPGSGSSVMAYAGICRQDNLQEHSDPYFSFHTIDEATAYTEGFEIDVTEVQTVSLRDFAPSTDTLTISSDAAADVPVTAYTEAGIEAAVETATGEDVSIAEWGYDEYVLGATLPSPDATGFQVIFNSVPSIEDVDATDVDQPAITIGVTGGSGFVGETAQGGPDESEGFAQEATGNTSPAVTAPEDKTIPMRTPFALTGAGTDANGDALTYLWEQADFGSGTRLPDNVKLNGPLFRVFGTAALVSDEDALKSPAPGINIADGNPTRVFPDMAQVLAGNTNAATGDCPPPADATVPLTPEQLECFSEYLPEPGYTGSVIGNPDALPRMRFRFTARDLFPTGGGVAFDDVTLNLDPTAGPFLVTSQATPGATVAGGTAVPVTWAVNNTQGLAPTVRISASTDGGRTFDTVLAAATPNDGSQTLTMPNVTAADVRIKIEAVDNYFFDVNDASFELAASPAPETTITEGPVDGSVVFEKVIAFDYAASPVTGTFVCTVDGKAVACGSGGKSLRFRAGTHVFTVAAVNAAGVTDPTPASVTFTVPRDDGQLIRKKGEWRRVVDKRAYGNDYVTSRDKGTKLIARIRKATGAAIVVGTRRNAGTIKVFVGDDKVKTFSLKGRNATKQLRRIDFDGTQTGNLKIVVGKNKPVRIEGVAVITDPS